MNTKEIIFLIASVFVGLSMGYIIFSAPIYLSFHSDMNACHKFKTIDGCKNSDTSGCLWIPNSDYNPNNTSSLSSEFSSSGPNFLFSSVALLNTNNEVPDVINTDDEFICVYSDYASVNCSIAHNNPSLCVSISDGDACKYLYTTNKCLHVSGWSQFNTGFFAAMTISGGAFGPFLIGKFNSKFGSVNTLILMSMISFLSAGLFTYGIETGGLAIWSISKVLSSIVSFSGGAVLPDVLRRVGIQEEYKLLFLRLLGMNIGICAVLSAIYLYLESATGETYEQNPHIQKRLQIFNVVQWIISAGYLIMAPAVHHYAPHQEELGPAARKAIGNADFERSREVPNDIVVDENNDNNTETSKSVHHQKNLNADDDHGSGIEKRLLAKEVESDDEQQQQQPRTPKSSTTITPQHYTPPNRSQSVTPRSSRIVSDGDGEDNPITSTGATANPLDSLAREQSHLQRSSSKAASREVSFSASSENSKQQQKQQMSQKDNQEQHSSPASSPGSKDQDQERQTENNNNNQPLSTSGENAEEIEKEAALDYIRKLQWFAGIATGCAQQLTGLAAFASYVPIILQDLISNPIVAQLFFASGLPIGAITSALLFTRYFQPWKVFAFAAVNCSVASLIVGLSIYPGIISDVHTAGKLSIFGVTYFAVSFGSGPSSMFIATLGGIFKLKGTLLSGMAVCSSVAALVQVILRFVFPIFVKAVSDDVRVGRATAFFTFFGMGVFSVAALYLSKWLQIEDFEKTAEKEKEQKESVRKQEEEETKTNKNLKIDDADEVAGTRTPTANTAVPSAISDYSLDTRNASPTKNIDESTSSEAEALNPDAKAMSL